MELKLPKDNIYCETIKELAKLIQGTKFENRVFLVGGAVRDLLMGKEIKDIDLCVNLVNGGIEFADWVCKETGCYSEGSNPCIYPTYGTAKFNLRTIHNLSKVDIECVQTRSETYNDRTSRNPQTTYGTISEDAMRRDLTINALYYNISSNTIVDPSGFGLRDIKQCTLRTPTDPNKTYSDDPLRMLRAIRFSAKLGWGIDKDTWLGIVSNVHRIGIVSQERITDEINKILLCDKPSIGIRKLYYSGLLKIVLPDIYKLVGLKQGIQHFGDVFEHTMSVIDNTKPIIVNRLGGLFHDCGKADCVINVGGRIHFFNHEFVGESIARETLKDMKYSTAIINKVCIAIRNHMRFKSSGNNCPSNKALRKFISDVGENNVGVALDVIHADNVSHSKGYCYPEQVPLILTKLHESNVKKELKMPINGKDIMDTFKLKSSPKVGELLDVVKETFLENPNLTKEQCLKIVKAELTI